MKTSDLFNATFNSSRKYSRQVDGNEAYFSNGSRKTEAKYYFWDSLQRGNSFKGTLTYLLGSGLFKSGGLIWYTVVNRKDAGVWGESTWSGTEEENILATWCTCQGVPSINLCNFIFAQVALRALDAPIITSKLVWGCSQEILVYALSNRKNIPGSFANMGFKPTTPWLGTERGIRFLVPNQQFQSRHVLAGLS